VGLKLNLTGFDMKTGNCITNVDSEDFGNDSTIIDLPGLSVGNDVNHGEFPVKKSGWQLSSRILMRGLNLISIATSLLWIIVNLIKFNIVFCNVNNTRQPKKTKIMVALPIPMR